jgi:hypothetical protein
MLVSGLPASPSRSTQTGELHLRDRRVKAVCDALTQAGVPAGNIKTGAFGDPKPRRDARVKVLITTSPNYTTSQN